MEGTPKVTDLRPVTLLNCTYKLLSMVLVQRLNRVLPEVIISSHLEVPGKEIMSGGHNLVSTIQFINHDQRRGGFVASWDQVKAHDRANRLPGPGARGHAVPPSLPGLGQDAP